MGFKLIPEATFTATVQIPNGDAALPLKCEFKRKSKTELVAFVNQAGDMDDVALCEAVLSGWHDVDRAYSRDALVDLLEAYAGAPMAIYMRYLEAHSRAERKN